MKLRRQLTEEEKAWRELTELWDASLGELNAKLDRVHAEQQETTDDE